MAQRNDQIFQLSLTEIAFTIAFLLLLLLGYLVFKEQTEREAAEAALAKVQTVEHATAALDVAKSELSAQLRNARVTDPDEVISKLIASEEIRAERDRLQQRVDDLDAKLTALTELRQRLERTIEPSRPDVMQDELLSALALQEQVREAVEQMTTDAGASAPAGKAAPNRQALDAVRQSLKTTSELRRQLKEKLDKELAAGQEARTIEALVTAASSHGDPFKAGRNPESIRKENADLRGQVAFLKNRLDARGGRDFPPCWADENGKVEFLFSIELRPDSVVISPAWPARREASARALPDIDAALSAPHAYPAFVTRIQGVFDWSKAQDPECRHYVQLKSSIPDAVASDRARLMVENYFYKVEARR